MNTTAARTSMPVAGEAARVAPRELLVVIAVAIAGAGLLFLSAPRAGEFWWSDAPRHALNGVFLRDLIATLPWRDPAGWAMQYYIQYPALTILFYPPLFYLVSAPFFALFGVSHAVSLGVVMAHAAALAVGMHLLARRFVPPTVALPVALLALAAPGIALWGRQPMLEVPSLAFAVWAMLVLRRYVETPGTARLLLGLLLLLCAIYTKFSAVFLIPVAGLMLLAADPRGTLTRPRHWLAGAAFLLALAPAVVLTLHFGGANLQSVASIPDAAVGKWTLAGWTWYARALPELLGLPLLLAALAGLGLLALR
ncbi:MAG: glycosyltransferase family 39 protein, partial [Acetobacteraceae bacterium]|nr:glycosyltransferase family 39 protein [Acetobacteraceae bacterium]